MGKSWTSCGLYGLGTAQIDLYLHPATIWTFEYSQLTHSIILSIQNLQFDIFMNKFLGFPLYAVFFILIITLHFFLIRKTINSKNISNRK